MRWLRHGSFLALVLVSAPLRGAADAACGAQTTMAETQITKDEYRGWPNTYRLANGLVEARIVTDIGPRIIDVRPAGGANLFHVRDLEAGRAGEPDWVFRGGWRLWIAPERRDTTYVPDNAASQVEVVGAATVRVVGPPQPAAGIQKIIEVTAPSNEPRLRVVSRIRNIGDTPRTYAAWSLAVMRPGGRAFVPQDVGPLTAFDATRRLLLWSYTRFADPRYHFGDRLVQIDHRRVVPGRAGAARGSDESKIGVDSAQGWAAYLVDGVLFLKRFPHDPTGQYPDGGATIEVYSNHEFLELEHLGALTTIQPGGEIVLPEDWWVFPAVSIPAGEADALAVLEVHVGRTPFR